MNKAGKPNRGLEEMTSAELGKLFLIVLVEHDPAWEVLFNVEKKRIEMCLDGITRIRINHIGSTAIPGIIAKPTIDILLEINYQQDELTSSESVNDKTLSDIKHALQKEGYYGILKPENPPPHLMFVKGYTLAGFSGQSFHVHVRYPGDWDEIRFRDYLIRHPDAAAEYAALKIRLAEQFRNDREGYTGAKGDFIRKIGLTWTSKKANENCKVKMQTAKSKCK